MKRMSKVFLFLWIISGPLCWAEMALDLATTKSYRNDQGFNVELSFHQIVTDRNFKFDFINRTIQIDIPQAQFARQKVHTRVNDSEVSGIFVYQLPNQILRCRINLMANFTAQQYKTRVSVSNLDKIIRIEIKGQNPAHLLATTETITKDLPPPRSLEQEAEKSWDLSEESPALDEVPPPIDDSSTTDTTRAASADVSQKIKKESEIPVLNKSKTSQSPMSFRYLVSASILLCILFIGSYFLLREYRHRHKIKNKQTQIKIVTQHYLGPKKSLAIIRVAGESLLIGITEQNINLIKALSLLDDELPAIDQTSFAKTMDEVTTTDGANATSNLDDFAVKEIREIVHHRLKGLREI